MMYKAFFGITGALLTTSALYYSVKILRNLENNEETAIAMFLLKDEVEEVFRMLSYVTIIYSVTALMVVAGILPDSYPYDMAVIALFTGLLFFVKDIYSITSGNEE
ncbi:MAG: hypothetical protein ABEK04_02260 [Candidatus Nanohalobium sp.]